MANKVISVIGYMDVDLYMTTERMPDPGECLKAKSYVSAPGGKGANAAMAAFRSSHKKIHSGDEAGQYHFRSCFENVDIEVRMIGRVGDDAYGPAAKRNLEENGINVAGVQVLPGELTGVCFALIEAFTGENRLLFTTGATDRLLPEDFTTPESLGVDVRPDLLISQLEVRRETVEQMLRTAHQAGIDVLLNAAPAQQILPELYSCITHLIVNETEAAMLYGVEVNDVNSDTWEEIALYFLEDGAQNVVITLGSQGAYFANHKDKGHALARQVTVMDVTGAGDTFVGVYATEYLRQKALGEAEGTDVWDIRTAVERANKASAHTIRKVGAQETIPWGDEIDEVDKYSEELSNLSVGDATFSEDSPR